MILDPKVTYDGNEESSDTKNLLEKIYNAINRYNSIKTISIRDEDCILVDFDDHFTSWGHYDDLKATGWYIESFTSYEDVGDQHRMWLVRYP